MKMVKRKEEASLNKEYPRIALSLEQYAQGLRIEKKDGTPYLWDPIRRKWIRLQPEEFLRQLFISFLQNYFPLSRIAIEKNAGMKRKKRFDLMVYDQQLAPFLLIELKEASKALSPEVILQAGLYKEHFNPMYWLISNGHEHMLFQYHPESGQNTPYKEWPFPLIV
jgi:hypothetical protein